MSLKVRGIVCHVSASMWGDAKEIDSWHKDRGWNGIGYHGVILNGMRNPDKMYSAELDGKIEPGRPEDTVGAHCQAGGMNSVSLGVCCIGNPGWAPKHHSPGLTIPLAPDNVVSRKYLTNKQYGALVHWLAVNCKQYGLNPLGKFKHPTTGKLINVISQHSDHDKGKPLCASLKLGPIRLAVAEHMKTL